MIFRITKLSRFELRQKNSKINTLKVTHNNSTERENMKIVKIRNSFDINDELKDLKINNYSMTPSNTKIYENYMDSQSNDSEKRKNGEVPIGLNETMREYLGITSLNMYLNQDGKIVLYEMTGTSKNIIKFDNPDSISKYVDYLNKLGIYCKLYNTRMEINRENENSEETIVEEIEAFYPVPIVVLARQKENFNNYIDENKEKFKITEHKCLCFEDNNFELIANGKKIEILTEEQLRRAILSKFSDMTFDDISDSGLSMHEYRKIIGMQYQDIELTQDEISAMNAYKHGSFAKINGFLRGDLSCLNEEQLGAFFSNEIDRIINYSVIISQLQKRFSSKSDMKMIRTDKRNDIAGNRVLSYDNFVSTSATKKLVDYKFDGIKKGNYLYINIPKGTPIFPMDLIMEKKLQLGMRTGRGSTDFDEAEWLLPMCELETDNTYVDKNGRIIVNSKVTRIKNPLDVILTRINDFEGDIVKYAGNEKLDELRAKVQAMKSQNIEKTKFSENEIGKATISISTIKKDEAQEKQQRDNQQMIQEGQKNFGELK